MTLFIACLLIYHLDMDPWWYVVAVLIYAGHLAAMNWRRFKGFRAD